MKSSIITVFVVLISMFSSSAQESWINYEFDVPPEKAEAFVGALNTFFNTKTGKSLPIAYLTEQTLGNQEVTHHVSFVSDDVDLMGKLLDPSNWESEDWMKLGMAMTELGTLPIRSFSGMPIVASLPKPEANNGFQVIYAMRVGFNEQMNILQSFQSSVSAMQPLLDDLNIEISLHQHIAGDDRNVTHWAIESHQNYASFLRAQQRMMQSAEMGKMFDAMGRANVQNPMTIARTVLIAWNTPK